MNVEELKQKALAATPGPWYDRSGVLRGTGGGIKPIATIYNGLNSPYIAAANPTAILELIWQRDELLAALKRIGEYSRVSDAGIIAAEVRRLREENERLADDMERCYRMLLSEPDVKGALFKAENILRESLADRGKR